MQNSKRERGSLSKLSRVPRIAFTCICAVVLVSCSTLKTPNVKNQLSEFDPVYLEKLCLNSEGKGQLFQGRKGDSFNYEMGLDLDARKWILSIEIPFKGEEAITLDFSSTPPSVSGKLYQRLKDSGAGDAMVRPFYTSLANFLEFFIAVKKNQVSCQSAGTGFECVYKNKRYQITFFDESLTIEFIPLERQIFKLVGRNDRGTHWNRLTLFMNGAPNAMPNYEPLKMDLYLESCSQ